MTDDEHGAAARDEKRAGWVRLIGEGLEKQSRRKELMSSGGRKDVKQIITLRKGCLVESGGPSRGQGEGPQIWVGHRKDDSLSSPSIGRQ